MIRKKKNYSRPKKLYEKTRIEEENQLALKYGLKNKREIWKTLALVNYYRSRAKELAKASREEQEVLFNKLRALGLKVATTTDVLALQVEDLLKRRLPSVIYRRNLAATPQQARQLVTHKKVRIAGNVVNVPSYLVATAEEDAINVEKGKTAEMVKAEKAEAKESKE